MRTRVVPISVFLLVVLGCGRHREPQSRDKSETRAQSAPVAISPQSPAAPSFTPVASQSAGEPEAPRPSPFATLPDADRQANITTTTPATSEPAPHPPSKPVTPSAALKKPLKAFDLSSIQKNSRDRIAPLPAPPELQLPGQAATSNLPFGVRPCCTGTATLEPAKPARIQRMLRRVPGLRRIGQAPNALDGYVAPRPARDITMVLPPQARSILTAGTMSLKASVNESGGVTRVELLSPRNEELIRLAAYAAGSWQFVPASLNDRTVPSEVILHFNFSTK